MGNFDYFFGFYSIVLGLSVVEVLVGVARTIENRKTRSPSRLTLLLAAFLACDLSSYWLQAWFLYQQAPLSMAVITHGLIAAGCYFIAAYLIFPRSPKRARGEKPDDHFWSTRRWVFGAVLLTNVLNVGTIVLLMGGFGFIGPPAIIAFTASFYVACLIAFAAPRGRVAVFALFWLLAYSVVAVGLDASNIVARGGWEVGPPT